jgi:hypothetical protein
MTPKVCAAGKASAVAPRRTWALALGVGLAAAVACGIGVATDQPHFADESAFIAQSYFFDLWKRGDLDSPYWLDYPAIDLPPLPKYLIGAALDAGGYSRGWSVAERRRAALAWQFGDVNLKFASGAKLRAARWPSVACGALGCVAIFALGTLAAGRRVGLVAAGLLMINPLYRLQAGRAMADAPAEALILGTAAVGLAAWRGMLTGRRPWLWAVAGGIVAGWLGGLAVLAKLNGGLGLMIVASWAIIAVCLRGIAAGRKVAVVTSALIAGVVAFATFVRLNPFMTAHPRIAVPAEIGESVRDRASAVVRHRAGVSRAAQDRFPNYALRTAADKVMAVAVQGFGRFGPLGPPWHDSLKEYPRFDWSRDGGALIWAPWVALGGAWAVLRGRRQLREGRAPTAWAILVQAAVALVTVTAFIPLAWDRYFLSLQPGSALLAAGVAVAACDTLRRSVVSSRVGSPGRPSGLRGPGTAATTLMPDSAGLVPSPPSPLVGEGRGGGKGPASAASSQERSLPRTPALPHEGGGGKEVATIGAGIGRDSPSPAGRTPRNRGGWRGLRAPAVWAFGILFGSYAFFWHARDWNLASRLMLTYALVDRGTVRLDGLEVHTGDIAEFEGHYYTDKLPGLSLLAALPYRLAKGILRLPDHPLGVKDATPFRHWPADYWATLGTSGLLSACTGAVLAVLATRLGCGPRRSALVGLAYGLATPAFVYATLAYGHQATAFALLASFALLWRGQESRLATLSAGLAGFLAAAAAVVELQVGPVAAILGLYLLAQVVGKRRSAWALAAFVAGAMGPLLVLLGYNVVAFGTPWDMGYFHERLVIFKQVHTASNPLGLQSPDWSRASALLWGGYRGLFYYAPILLLAVPGWVVLIVRHRWDVAAVSAAVCLVIFLVNLSYPEWTGGWSTGPRLLVPLLPFAMLPVAAVLAVGGRAATGLAIGLALAGGVLMLLFQGVGGRVPHDIPDPLASAVWPLWRGDPLPRSWPGGRFDRTLVSWLWPGAIQKLPGGERWVQFLPLVAFQAVGIVVMLWACRAGTGGAGSRRPLPSF